MEQKKSTTKYLETVVGKPISEEKKDEVNNNNNKENHNNSYKNKEDMIKEDMIKEAVPWPDDLSEEAMYGLAGEIVKSISPYSEADDAALLMNCLAAFGNVIGHNCYFIATSDIHYMNIFILLVGKSSKARKGASWGYIKKLFYMCDEKWIENNLVSGLASGEGVIFRVRDEVKVTQPCKNKKGFEEVIKYKAVDDKRLLVLEEEFSALLQVMARHTNTLSQIIRRAWDGKSLQTLAKNEPVKATNAHISIIGHITIQELKKCIKATDIFNGFANRFLFVCCRRSKLLPDGEPVPESIMCELANKLKKVVEFAGNVGRIKRDNEADEYWRNIYAEISKDNFGISGEVINRAEPQIMRIACLYALLDCSNLVKVVHLKAALAVWKRCEESAYFIFGEYSENPIANIILDKLKNGPMTQSQIYTKVFKNNKSSKQITNALEDLSGRGKIKCKKIKPNGRETKLWEIV